MTFMVAVLAAIALGIITGVPGLRLASWSLGMVTFFMVLLVPDIVQLLSPFTGGSAGLAGIPPPSLFGHDFDTESLYILVIAVTIVVIALLRNYIVSRHGTALKVIKQSPDLARSLGYSVPRMKLTAYVISAFPAGAAGCLFAYDHSVVTPESFSFSLTVAILAASIIGGSSSIYGAVFGATVMVIGPLRAGVFQEFALVFFGLLLVVGGLFLTNGAANLLDKAFRRIFVKNDLMPDVREALQNPKTLPQLTGCRLRVSGLNKNFNGNQALKNVHFVAEPGQIIALIGPNGSGKTTLLNAISGFVRPDSGEIRVGDSPLTRLSAHHIARRGVARTFQTPLIPRGLTVAEVVASARYRSEATSVISGMLTLPDTRGAIRRDRDTAISLLSVMGVVELADVLADDLPLGTRRIVEVARALASSPSLLLLDEPASGLDEVEVHVLADVVRRLRDAGATIVIVEHNFEMITSVADRIDVLHLGHVIASGSANQVRNNPAVIESYLGRAARQRAENDRGSDRSWNPR
ncbi:amino acid/amide ABC transporter membrane protein 2, HAAT family /amino acid/amide ABC transporter ATP-binding protein 1, HAAT family [Pseudonocardia oroxyli]|uniref:Amino acid/amide ABC transporter membrane protein 2, HAAT family /amino acid/amide ABC transporter ATP-binding protein 1, HAAT family n=1 Tax=Pseudonocardia oroxyli TaxID=366584 RepID=A0A1G8D239_PSEOR|nr:amino acid/amide ABC transporter membrane protein 2, HAAT family /amino acid/amide ABC transporter ATP-binding protein 1, HAAT family [Pseudonocardia oroxyli]